MSTSYKQLTSLGIYIGILLMLSLPAGVGAATEHAIEPGENSVRISRSHGSQSTDSRRDLSTISPRLAAALVTTGPRERPAKQVAQNAARAATHHPEYWIFSANTVLIHDDDDDGHYHRFEVSFDADVSFGHAFVYAELFLSYEGGPWNHLFTTDVFSIHDTDPFDDYHVETALQTGYPTGYYDVLIELYEADFDTKVADFGPNESAALIEVPLEDQDLDQPLGHVSIDAYGGGSTGLPGLLLLAGAAVARRFRITYLRIRSTRADDRRPRET